MSDPSNYAELQEYLKNNPLEYFPGCLLDTSGARAEMAQRHGPGEFLLEGAELNYYPNNNSGKFRSANEGTFLEHYREYSEKRGVYNSLACTEAREPEVTETTGPETHTETRPRNDDGAVSTEPGAAEDTGEETSEETAGESSAGDATSPGSGSPSPQPPAGAPAGGTAPAAGGTSPAGGTAGSGGANVPAPATPAPAPGLGERVGQWWDGLSTGQKVAVGVAAAAGVVIAGAVIAYFGGVSALVVAAGVALRAVARFIPRALGWLVRQGARLLGRAKRAVERIIARIRRNARKCLMPKGNPIYVSSGVAIQDDPVFVLPGIFELAVTSRYQSDITESGPLGRGRVSDIDATLQRLPDGKLRYIDNGGYHVDFHRPTPNIGQWNDGDHVRALQISAGPRRSFVIRENGILRYFAKCPDGKWRITDICDRRANRLSFGRDRSGRLDTITTPEGLKLLFSYDPRSGLRKTVHLQGTDGQTRLIMRYDYDARGNMTYAESPCGNLHEYGYDARNLRTHARINGQYEARYVFDDLGRCIAEHTNGPNNGNIFQYHPELRLTRMIPCGDHSRMETYYYNEQGAVFGEAHVSGRLKWTLFDDDGNVSRVQDGNGNAVRFRYDHTGNVTSVEDAEGRRWDYRWTDEGKVSVFMDQNGVAHEYSYDEYGNLVSSRDALGFVTDLRCDAAGLVTGISRPDGMIRFLSYTANHWLASETDFDGRTTSYERDGFGRLTAVDEGGLRRITYRYSEEAGQDFWLPSEIRLEDRVITRSEVIEPRRRVARYDGGGRRTEIAFDAFGKVDELVDAGKGMTRFRYNAFEELIGIEDPLGQKWTAERDAFGRVTRETGFDGQVITCAYDDADQLSCLTFADGTRHEFERDKSGRLLERRVIELEAAPLVTRYSYDSRGLLEKIASPDATLIYERDALGQVIGETVNETRIGSVYDCCGRRVHRRIGSEEMLLGYDPAGRLTGLRIGAHEPLMISHDALGHEAAIRSAAGFGLDMVYDRLGLLQEQAGRATLHAAAGAGQPDLGQSGLNAGFGHSGPAAHQISFGRSYRWNASREPSMISDQISGSRSYEYDLRGQVTRTDYADGGTEQFDYDSALNLRQSRSRLSGAPNPGAASAGADPHWALWQTRAGGRVERAATADGATLFLLYDSRNRVVTRRLERQGFRPKIWHYKWNGQDQLTETLAPDESRWTYGYDGLSRRIWKQQWLRKSSREAGVARIIWQAARRHSFLWDGGNMIAETVSDPDGTTQRTEWFYDPDGDAPLARREAGRLSYIVTDHLGTPQEILSEDGRLEWASRFSTWGGPHSRWSDAAAAPRGTPGDDLDWWTRPAAQAAPSFGGGLGAQKGNLALASDELPEPDFCPIRFPGQWADHESGLCYNRYRYYDPDAASYISPDPVGINGGLRSHGYAASPVTGADPEGLDSRKLGDALIGAGKYPGNYPAGDFIRSQWRAHHVIPEAVWGSNRRFLNSLGLSMDDADNGIWLPYTDGMDTLRPAHRDNHPGFSNAMRRGVRDIQDMYNSDRRQMPEFCARMRARWRIQALQASAYTALDLGRWPTRVTKVSGMVILQ